MQMVVHPHTSGRSGMTPAKSSKRPLLMGIGDSCGVLTLTGEAAFLGLRKPSPLGPCVPIKIAMVNCLVKLCPQMATTTNVDNSKVLENVYFSPKLYVF